MAARVTVTVAIAVAVVVTTVVANFGTALIPGLVDAGPLAVDCGEEFIKVRSLNGLAVYDTMLVSRSSKFSANLRLGKDDFTFHRGFYGESAVFAANVTVVVRTAGAVPHVECKHKSHG